MVRKIVQFDKNKVLREKAQKVPLEDIGAKKIKSVIQDMKIALKRELDGVAIAAPQIGVALRIFVVSGRAFAVMKGEDEIEDKYPDMVFINPVIQKISRKKIEIDEGCLSVRGKYGKVRRAEKTTVSAYDENGNKFTYGASGLLSQIFQHETDHLEGVLFIDKAKSLEEI